MATIQLFFNVNIPENDEKWYENISSALKKYRATEQVEVINKVEKKSAQIDVSYQVENGNINEIELIITNSGASIDEINIHFPSSVTGVADPYTASGESIPLHEKLKKMNGILDGGISSSGQIKIVVDPLIENKQLIIEEFLKNIHFKDR